MPKQPEVDSVTATQEGMRLDLRLLTEIKSQIENFPDNQILILQDVVNYFEHLYDLVAKSLHIYGLPNEFEPEAHQTETLKQYVLAIVLELNEILVKIPSDSLNLDLKDNQDLIEYLADIHHEMRQDQTSELKPTAGVLVLWIQDLLNHEDINEVVRQSITGRVDRLARMAKKVKPAGHQEERLNAMLFDILKQVEAIIDHAQEVKYLKAEQSMRELEQRKWNGQETVLEVPKVLTQVENQTIKVLSVKRVKNEIIAHALSWGIFINNHYMDKNYADPIHHGDIVKVVEKNSYQNCERHFRFNAAEPSLQEIKQTHRDKD